MTVSFKQLIDAHKNTSKCINNGSAVLRSYGFYNVASMNSTLRNGHVSNGKIKANGDRNVSIPLGVEFIVATI